MIVKIPRKKSSFSFLLITFLSIGLVFIQRSKVFADMGSTNYKIISNVVGSAEGKGSSANYDLLVNLGEEGISKHSSTNWGVAAGFLNTVNTSISISLDSGTKSLGSVLPLNSATGTTVVGVTTDAIAGYSLSAYFSSPDHTETLRHTNTTTYISDKTDWDSTANSGNGNASVWSGSGFGFCVYANDSSEKNTTWWGTGTTETDSNNKYAGFPSSSNIIVASTSYKSGARSTSVGYKILVPDGQLSGSYSGNVTFSAVSNL